MCRTMHKIVTPLVSIIVMCLLGSLLAVSVNGAALNVGSGDQYKSITEAVNAAQPGDTITISPGTYSENVVVTKSVTIKAASPGSTTVTAADPSKDVFLVQGKNIRIEGLTITGATGASGVHVQGASACFVTGISAHGNDKAVYLDGATNCEVSSSSLADNGYGVYCDNSSHNTISNNVATGEKGGSTALGDGIYMYYSDSNTVTHSNLSSNHVYGLSIFHSSGNTISNNSILKNEDIGIRLRESNNNTLTFNTFSGNVNLGILSITEAGDQIYLNNFVSQSNPHTSVQANVLTSPQKMTYTYNGATYSGYISNYYSDYKGTDANGDGIGDTPSAYGEQYPLMQPFERYGTISVASSATPTPSTEPITQNASTTSVVEIQNSSALALPRFEAWYAAVGLLALAFVILGIIIKKYYFSAPQTDEDVPPQTYEDQPYEGETYEE